MISYAQNAEDVVLARALPGDSGFYVDVGASTPDSSSVTRHFYEQGWRGINIEPRDDAHELLEARRPRDINLKVAVGSTDGVATFYRVIRDPDLSTTDEEDLALLRASGYEYEAESVEVRTLTSILDEHDVEHIDFLKIDAEGSEEAVLRGFDFVRWRPRVILIEAIRPWSRERADGRWRNLLETQGYVAALFDGINLFFGVEGDEAILGQLVPASPLDSFQPADVVALHDEIDFLRARLALAEQANDGSEPPEQLTPPRLARLVVIGAPYSGAPMLRRGLAAALGVVELVVEHPGDVDWHALPSSFVMELCWARTRRLKATLQRIGAIVIAPARHPLDVLAAVASEPASQGESGADGSQETSFADRLTTDDVRRLLEVTPDWWSAPSTLRVRYEDLVADPRAGLEELLVACGQDPSSLDWGTLSTDPIEASPSLAVAPSLREILHDHYADVLHDLGYGERPQASAPGAVDDRGR